MRLLEWAMSHTSARCPRCYAHLLQVVGWRGGLVVRVEVRCASDACGWRSTGGPWLVGVA